MASAMSAALIAGSTLLALAGCVTGHTEAPSPENRSEGLKAMSYTTSYSVED